MVSADSFGARGTLSVGDTSFEIHRLSAVDGADRLPFSLKVLLENLLRTEDGADITADDVRALAGWDPAAEPDREIRFSPARVVMQDFTGVPAIVDLATMREAMRDLGGDAGRINPLAPAELVIDHSVVADLFGTPDSFSRNVELEYERNHERYQFLRWGQGAFDDFKVVPPGTGIVHQVNIEYLARVVFTAATAQAYPDTLRRHRLAHHDGQRARRARLGRRRHRGRGGDARPAGVDAHPPGGRLQARRRAARGLDRHRPGADDHEMLRKHGVVGKFVEFYGPGVGAVPLANRATIGNMCPEYGSTCAIFPIDDGDPALPAAHRPAARSRSRSSRRTRRSRGSGTTRPPSRPTRRRSSSTWPASCRRWPARSARRTGCRWPRPSRRSGPCCRLRTDSDGDPDRDGRGASPRHSRPATRRAVARQRHASVPDTVGPRPARRGRAGRPDRGDARGRHRVRDRPRRGRDRGDHLVHQHVQPVGDDRRRTAGQEGRRARAAPASRG